MFSEGSRWLEYLGKNSLQFYLFNGFALVPARVICAKLFGINNPLFLVSAIFLLCIVFLIILTEVSKRIPVIRYLCGFGRKKNEPIKVL